MSARRRLLVGAGALVAVSSVVRRDRVGPREVAVFRAVNELPDGLFRGAWVVMQGGALGAAPVAAAVARAAGRPRLARHLLGAGCASWALAKVAKVFVQRPRPVLLLPGTRCRGREATGLGYLSGHAAVSAALASAALARLGPRGRLLSAAAPVVGLSRVYVGAHLPLDVVGGAALGVAVEAGYRLLEVTPTRPPRRPPHRPGRRRWS